MNIFTVIFEIIGTVSFAMSGALTGIRKHMDIFGVCVLGLTTATFGGICRDLILGITPPATFRNPIYAFIAIGTSAVMFFLFVCRISLSRYRAYEAIMLITDSAGLGIFTVCGALAAIEAGFGDNLFLVVFVSVITGVGGGVMRDIFAGDRPYIFIKHIYACASLIGALLTVLIWNIAGKSLSMIIGFSIVVAIRLLAAYFRLSLPKAREIELTEDENKSTSFSIFK